MRMTMAAGQAFQEMLGKKRIYFSASGRVRPISNLMVEEDAIIEPFTGFFGGTSLCQMGSFSYSMSGVRSQMKIGRYCSIATGLGIPGTRHPIEWVTTSNISYERKGPLLSTYFAERHIAPPAHHTGFLQKPLPIIGNDVWIAQNVTINTGVTIGDGSVIASNSVVTKNVPAYSIMGGNPAKLIRPRFTQDRIDLLLEIEWWRYEPSSFMHLDITNIDEFLEGFSDVMNHAEPYTPAPVTGAEIYADAVTLGQKK